MSEKTPDTNALGSQVESHEASARLETPSPKPQTLLGEFGAYLMQNKKWWMLPIIVMVLVLSALFLLLTAMPVVAPFNYPLF